MRGLVEHDFSLLMQEFCNGFEIREILISHSCRQRCWCRFKTSVIWHCVTGQGDIS
jgi:hypothetical protein